MTEKSTAIAPVASGTMASMFLDPAKFDHLQRVGKMFAASGLVPEHLRDNPANCMIAFAIAQQLGENPLVVMQNIHIVKGKAGWSAQYMIARTNASGILRDPIDWEASGKGDSLSVTAFAVRAATGKRVAFSADMKMAHAEGWDKNPKYRSMPDLMLRYRSATFLIRLNCPEVMMGYQTVEEIEDVAVAASAPEPARETPAADLGALVDMEPTVEAEYVNPETGEVTERTDLVRDETGAAVPDPAEVAEKPKRSRKPAASNNAELDI